MRRSHAALPLVLLMLAAGAAVQAQPYKVIESDGHVTYTDRPSAAPTARVQSLNLRSGASTTSLPFALQKPAAQFPVMLYTMPDCSACDRGRAYLRQRGIPYTEKTVASVRDRDAWASLNLGTEVPVLRVGQQVLRNFVESQWASDLDLAGYPSSSQLPANYRGWEPSPLAGAEPPPSPQLPAALPPVLQSSPDGIRF